MAYYATETLQPITAGTSKPAAPTSGLGCAPCAAAAAGLGATPILAVSGLGEDAPASAPVVASTATSHLGTLLTGAALGVGVLWIATSWYYARKGRRR